MVDALGQRIRHWWRTARSHRLVLVPRPPADHIRAEVLGSNDPAPLDYHIWYYGSSVWKSTSWLGVRAFKSVTDMWNYQEIISDVRPRLVVEFGTKYGGSALFFASVLDGLGLDYRVLSVDTVAGLIDEKARRHPRIELLTGSSVGEKTRRRIVELRRQYPGPVFAILDSDHAADHVEAELTLLAPLLEPGDYVVVEDSNINGHPVLPEHGPGPYEAVERYLASHPDEFERDELRERKFGFTFAPGGFLVRR